MDPEKGHVVFICPPKCLDFEGGPHRADHLVTLHTVLEALNFQSPVPKHYCYLPGGGMVADAGVDMSAMETCLACFKGKLYNTAYLTKQYFEADLVEKGYGDHVPLAVLKQSPPFSVSTLICKLYLKFGPRFLNKLRGHWSFILYDSTTMRVLAAREPSGEVLWLGRLQDRSIVAAFGNVLPPDTSDVVELKPGFYKYGWHCEPLQFASSPSQTIPTSPHKGHGHSNAHSRSHSGGISPMMPASPAKPSGMAAAAALAAAGLAEVHVLVGSPPSKKGHKTRRGTRGGRSKRKSSSATTPPDSPRSDNSNSMQSYGSADAAWGVEEEEGQDASSREPEWDAEVMIKPKASLQLPPLELPETIMEEDEEHHMLAREGSDGSRPDDMPMDLPANLREHLDPATYDEASLRLLRSILYSSPCALTVTDAQAEDHPIVFVNKKFELQTGYTAVECVGQNCRFLQAPKDAERHPCYSSSSIRKAIETGKRCSVRILNYRQDGVPLMNSLSVVPLRNKEGKITHFIGMQTFTCVDDVVVPTQPGGPLGLPVPTGSLSSESTGAGERDSLSGLKRMKRTGSIRSKSKSCSDLAGMSARPVKTVEAT